MLSSLRIADFAIIESSELHLTPGLTALTGETGAGKSILVDALALVLGGRGTEKAIRAGREQTEIEALFEGVADPEVRLQLRDAGLDDDADALILRRILTRTGRSRCYVNGRLVTQAQLRAIAAPLCDLSSQHAQHRLLDAAYQLEVLDQFAGLHTGEQALRPRYEKAWQAWRAALATKNRLLEQKKARADRVDWLRFVQEELAALALQPGEADAIQQKLGRLRAADQIVKALAEAAHRCEDDGGLRDQAVRVSRALAKLSGLDPKLASLAERADEIAALGDELARDLNQAARHVERDDRELARLAERQDAVLRAIKKHGGSEAALLERQAATARELDADSTELELADAERAERNLGGEVRELAIALHEARLQKAPGLAQQIAATVQRLGMPAATLRVDVHTRGAGELGPAGLDGVDVLLRANTGEGEGKLSEVASGGELSRVLLAVRRASLETARASLDTTQAGFLPTAIYDEVDAGLSGSTGLVLGQFLREVARRQQVIVISHLPQVAAAADSHVRVHKAESAGRTHSRLETLTSEGRLDELARMLGAAGQTRESALEHARRLLAGQSVPLA
jgi:DNA repair protein RecN (Recombination protein N)